MDEIDRIVTLQCAAENGGEEYCVCKRKGYVDEICVDKRKFAQKDQAMTSHEGRRLTTGEQISAVIRIAARLEVDPARLLQLLAEGRLRLVSDGSSDGSYARVIPFGRGQPATYAEPPADTEPPR